jgi:hypothetical protein
MNQKSVKHEIGLSNGGRGNRLSGTLRASIAALKEHSKKMVFENQTQAVRLAYAGTKF